MHRKNYRDYEKIPEEPPFPGHPKKEDVPGYGLDMYISRRVSGRLLEYSPRPRVDVNNKISRGAPPPQKKEEFPGYGLDTCTVLRDME